MSEENVGVVRRIVRAFCAGDWTSALNGYDEAVELDQSRMPDGGIYRGRNGMREFYRRWVGTWDHFHAHPVEFIDTGDAILVIMEISGTGKGSGVPVTMRTADVYTVAAGKIVRHVGYPEAAQALEAAGLSEQAMSEENVGIVRRTLEVQFGSGAAFDLGLIADDFEWILAGEPFEGRSVWRGREEWVEFVRLWTQDFDDFSFQVVRLIDAGGDRVVALLHQSGTGRESRAPVGWDNGVVFELTDGRVIRATNYLSHAEALEAAGLRE